MGISLSSFRFEVQLLIPLLSTSLIGGRDVMSLREKLRIVILSDTVYVEGVWELMEREWILVSTSYQSSYDKDIEGRGESALIMLSASPTKRAIALETLRLSRVLTRISATTSSAAMSTLRRLTPLESEFQKGGPAFVTAFQPVQTVLVAIMAFAILHDQFYVEEWGKRIFKKRSKKKAKDKQIQARSEKGKVKSHQNEENTT
ncbi:hypothetical protein Tco_0093780 [Tanacetum coccineum]